MTLELLSYFSWKILKATDSAYRLEKKVMGEMNLGREDGMVLPSSLVLVGEPFLMLLVVVAVLSYLPL